MATVNTVSSCCGFRDISNGGRSPKELLRDVLACESVASHILFTDRTSAKTIPELVSVIQSLGLGSIVQGPIAENPGTGHSITGWIYTPNYRKVRTFVNNF